MLDGTEDQATGLRRLFRRAPPLVAALFACGRDPQASVARALRRLQRAGGRTIVLDEGRGAGTLAAALGIGPGKDLLQIVDGCTPVSALVREASSGLVHLAVGGAALALPLLDEDRRDHLMTALHDLQRRCQLMIVCTATLDPERPSPFVLAAPLRLLVVEASGRGVTGGYAMIKQIAAIGAGDLAVAVEGARDSREAHELFMQLDELVSRRVGLPLRLAGEVERDDLFQVLALHGAPRREREAAAAFLRRLTAWAGAQRVAGGQQA